mmetsp:Transcript_18471/g.26568  ORF Transcript_18471/g.26568 Transcript_18471/m.26568 type:complete len:108 (-) Transcript_18471:72-395(-)
MKWKFLLAIFSGVHGLKASEHLWQLVVDSVDVVVSVEGEEVVVVSVEEEDSVGGKEVVESVDVVVSVVGEEVVVVSVEDGDSVGGKEVAVSADGGPTAFPTTHVNSS